MQRVKLKRPKGRCAKECSAPFLYEPLIVRNRKRPFFLDGKKAFAEEWEEVPPLCGGYTLGQNRAGAPALFTFFGSFWEAF